MKYVIKNLPENKPFQCEICKKDFARPTQMNSHKKVVHEGKKPYPCSEKGCKFKCDTRENFKIHISEVHEGIKLVTW